MLVEEYLDIPLGIHWLDPIFFLESFCQPIRSSSTIHWSPNHSPLQCTDALMMHIAHDMKQTWCECHSYPTSPSWCFTDKWKYISNIWLFQQRKIFGTKFGSFLAVQHSSIGDLVPNSLTPLTISLQNSTKWTQKLVSFETFDQGAKKDHSFRAI